MLIHVFPKNQSDPEPLVNESSETSFLDRFLCLEFLLLSETLTLSLFSRECLELLCLLLFLFLDFLRLLLDCVDPWAKFLGK